MPFSRRGRRFLNASGLTPPAPPALVDLTLSGASVAEGTAGGAVIGALLGKKSGSTLSLINNAGGRFALAGTSILTGALATDYESFTSHQIIVRETLAGSPNSPYDTTLTIAVTNVAEGGALAALTLAAATVAENTGAGILVGAINGKTSGSTITLVDDAGGRFALASNTIVTGLVSTDYETGTTHNITLRETLAGSPNSPRDSVIAITVTDVAESSPYLAVGDVFVLAGNSFEAQAGGNDNAGWARAFSNCLGYAPISWRHARGGDTLEHLLGVPDGLGGWTAATGRLSQILAMAPKGIFFMSPQNSMGLSLAQLQAQYEELVVRCRAAGVLKMVFPNQVKTVSSPEPLRANLNAWLANASTGLARHAEVVISDRAAVLDLTVPGFHNGAQDHTNARGAVVCGQVDGAAIRSCFAPGASAVSDYSAPLAGNFNADWNMADTNADGLCDGWALTNAYAGAVVTTQRSTFRSPGMTGVPCQVLKVTGTSAIDPITAGNEMRLRKTVAVPTGTAMTGKSWRMMMFVEITNADAADWAASTGPQNLASLNMTCIFASFMQKAYAASNGGLVMDKFAGLLSTLPAVQTAQNTNVTLDLNARPMANVAASYEIRFGYVMVLLDEQTAYAAPFDQTAALPPGRLPVFTGPAFTGAATQGTNLAWSTPGRVSGGGMVAPATLLGGGTAHPANGFMVRSPYALPGDVVGNLEGARPNGAAAVAYAVQAGDVGQKLKLGVQWENALGSITTYSAESATVT